MLALTSMKRCSYHYVSLAVVKEFNIAKAFSHCTKLTKDNYEIWFVGLVGVPTLLLMAVRATINRANFVQRPRKRPPKSIITKYSRNQ